MKTIESLKEEVIRRLGSMCDDSVLSPQNWSKQIGGMDKDKDNKGMLFYLDILDVQGPGSNSLDLRIERVLINMLDMTYTGNELEINEWKNKFFPVPKPASFN